MKSKPNEDTISKLEKSYVWVELFEGTHYTWRRSCNTKLRKMKIKFGILTKGNLNGLEIKFSERFQDVF